MQDTMLQMALLVGVSGRSHLENMQLLGHKERVWVLELIAQTRTISFVNAGRKMVQDFLVPPCWI